MMKVFTWCATAAVVVPLVAAAGGSTPSAKGTCGTVKDMYKDQGCCGNPDQKFNGMMIPGGNSSLISGASNPCLDKKPNSNNEDNDDNYWADTECWKNGARNALEQAGGNVTKGFVGDVDATGAGRMPLNVSYFSAGLCPVNVHWHLGAEHLSVGEYDENGVGPDHANIDDVDGEKDSRRLKAARLGSRCMHYDKTDTKFTTEYKWQHCEGMFVGETYEVHWPHSALGKCGTPWQYQTPFYDGVFCGAPDVINLSTTETWNLIGVHAQVFTIVNDENYYYPDMMRGMIMEESAGFGADVAYYTGSTTGTSRNNTRCSRYTPITWQVDRKCHLISASSFDKLCADMKNQMDDMSSDLHAHGSRELVSKNMTANNLQRL